GGKVYGLDRMFNESSSETSFVPLSVDVADESSVERALSRILSQEKHVDVLVNAAGIIHMGTVESLSVSAWQAMFDVNVTGPFHIMKRLIPLFKAQKSGAIVTVSSNAAHVPRTQMAGYAASK